MYCQLKQHQREQPLEICSKEGDGTNPPLETWMILWAQSQKTWQRAGIRSGAEKQGIHSRSGTWGYNPQCPSLPNYSMYSRNLAFNSGKQSRGLFTKNMNALWRVFKFLVWVLAAWSKYLISFWHLRIPKPSLKWECQSWIIRNKRKPSNRKAKFKEKREIQRI